MILARTARSVFHGRGRPPEVRSVPFPLQILPIKQKWQSRKGSAAFVWRRRKDLNLRAGCPTYTLSRGASSPLEYFSIFKLWFLSLPNYYIKFFRLCQGLSFKISKGFLKKAKFLDFAWELCYNKPSIIQK